MVPTPVVIIEQAPEVPEELRQAALDGCAQGLGEDQCRSGPPSSEALETSARAHYEARLVWNDDYDQVRIVVQLNPGQLERTILFQQSDSVTEKGAATGLVVATVVATRQSLRPTPEQTSEPTPATNETKERPAAPKSAVKEPPPTEERPRVQTDLAFLVGSGLAEGPVALGGAGRLSVASSLDPLFPFLGISYRRTGGSVVTSSQSRAWLGLGVHLEMAEVPLALELSGGPVGELFAVTASQEGEVRRETRLRFGAIAGADVVWPASKHVGLLLGCQVSTSWPDVDIKKQSEEVNHRGIFSWTTLAGIRLKL